MAPKARTFSVLPTLVLVRRSWSLPLIEKVMRWRAESMKRALDGLAELGIVVDAMTIWRLEKALRAIVDRLRCLPVPGRALPACDPQAGRWSMVEVLSWMCCSERGPPPDLPVDVAWNQAHHRMLSAF